MLLPGVPQRHYFTKTWAWSSTWTH